MQSATSMQHKRNNRNNRTRCNWRRSRLSPLPQPQHRSNPQHRNRPSAQRRPRPSTDPFTYSIRVFIMSNRTVPFTTTADELDKLLFSVLTAEFNALYPNDTRMALRAAMHVTDNAMTHIDALATRAAKSDQARRA